jgi:phosphomevalonate kinase
VVAAAPLSAPGKLFLAGEYAVLAGRPAVVAAVSPWGHAEERAAAAPWAGRYPGAPHSGARAIVDTSDFFRDGRKLGFGSSAAAGVLAVAAAIKEWPDTTELWRRTRDEAGNLVGQSGSGGDLAAILSGGVGLVTPRVDEAPGWRSLAFPPGALLLVVDAGVPADTRIWSARFRERLAAAELGGWLDAAEAAVLRMAGGDWMGGFAAAADVYLQLGDILGGDLWPEPLHRAADLLQPFGLRCKPSGAGGGDIGVALAPDPALARAACAALAAAGLDCSLRRPSSSGLRRIAVASAHGATLTTLHAQGRRHR